MEIFITAFKESNKILRKIVTKKQWVCSNTTSTTFHKKLGLYLGTMNVNVSCQEICHNLQSQRDPLKLYYACLLQEQNVEL